MFSSNSVPILDRTRLYQPLTNQEVSDWVTARNAKGKTTAYTDLNRYTLRRLQQDQLARDRNTAEGSLAPKEQAQEPLRNWIRSNLYDPVIPCISVTANIPIGSLRRVSNSRPMASELVANLSLLDQNNKRPNTNFIFAWNIAWNKFFAKLERRISPRSAPLIRLKYFRVYETTSDVFSPSAPLTHTHLIIQIPVGFTQAAFVESLCRAFDHFLYPLPRQDRRDATGPFATDPNPLDLAGRPLVIRHTRWDRDDLPQYIYDTKQLYGPDAMDRVGFGGFERNINKNVLPTE